MPLGERARTNLRGRAVVEGLARLAKFGLLISAVLFIPTCVTLNHHRFYQLYTPRPAGPGRRTLIDTFLLRKISTANSRNPD